jgi:hypothetical protein
VSILFLNTISTGYSPLSEYLSELHLCIAATTFPFMSKKGRNIPLIMKWPGVEESKILLDK